MTLSFAFTMTRCWRYSQRCRGIIV